MTSILRNPPLLMVPILLAALLAGCAHVPTADAGRQRPFAAAEAGYPYLRFLPADYGRDRQRRWPVIVFLHGSGERGSDIEKVKIHGPPMLVESDPDFRFVVISPQLETDGDWDVTRLDATLRMALSGLAIDSKRIYLTGLSRGGHTTWRWAAAEPRRFAAIAPVAGRGDPRTACALRDVPVWAFHGDADDIVPPRA